jgi:hypothetical protein
MAITHPLPFPDSARRQHHFWRLIGPRLRALPWIGALWLGLPPKTVATDRWDNFDLRLLVDEEVGQSSAAAHLTALLDNFLVGGWTQFHAGSLVHTSILDGIAHDHLPAAPDEGGVIFHLLWTTPGKLAAHLAWCGSGHLLWTRDDLPDDHLSLLSALWVGLPPGEASLVQAGLIDFWQALAQLPAVVNREEHLAAAALLHCVRTQLTDLVVALNGATRPLTPTRINPYLGPAQREAFEKTLRHSGNHAESWIGQAVALIVLYRWYAPQLVEMYRLSYPAAVESTVLALLSAEVPGWPARITTA